MAAAVEVAGVTDGDAEGDGAWFRRALLDQGLIGAVAHHLHPVQIELAQLALEQAGTHLIVGQVPTTDMGGMFIDIVGAYSAGVTG